ncbi:hypothetical protein D9Q98_004785 [Chlorella vulgaris]|uniref:C2HC zinc finger plants domain-containing protein n=1 Tax=Chlorella vulgaris TaxID=3077 RepID=A0A9D4TQB7_CHLVU|nr:hypothetical protein D9Q98_004785 [Chlorella vulgaris]
MLPNPVDVPQDSYRSSLARARELVAQGDPLTALKVLVALMRAIGLDRQADEAVARVLQSLEPGGSPSAAGATDELSGLLAALSLQQQHALPSQQAWSAPPILGPGQLEQAEGASFACQGCGGVVSVARRAAHQQLWCPALQDQKQQQQQQQELQHQEQQWFGS